MSVGLLIVLGLLALGILLLLLARRLRGSPGSQRTSPSIPERERAMAAQAEVEEHDIDEMMDARDELRRRAGRPSIGDELAEGALRRPDEP